MFPLSSAFKQFAVIAESCALLLPGHIAFNVLYPSFVFISGTPIFFGTEIDNRFIWYQFWNVSLVYYDLDKVFESSWIYVPGYL